MAQTDLDSGAAPWVLHGRPSQVSMATFHHSGGSNIYSELLKYPFKWKSMYICISSFGISHDPSILASHLQQVWGTLFYMGRFSAPTPKRHKVYSNCKALLMDLFDRAGYMSRNEQKACETKLVKNYFDKHGQRRCVGIRDKLRDSQ